MFGWINFMIRDLLINQFGTAQWEAVCAKVGIPASTTYPRNKFFADNDSLALVAATSEVLGVEVEKVLELFGEYFITFVRKDGYDGLLRSLGESLHEWLSNINSLHVHLEHTLGGDSLASGYRAPLFWATSDPLVKEEESINTLLMYYQSVRGALLASYVTGIVRAAARDYFDTIVTFERVHTQGVEGSAFTCWRLVGDKPLNSGDWAVDYIRRINIMADSAKMLEKGQSKCPFSHTNSSNTSSEEYLPPLQEGHPVTDKNPSTSQPGSSFLNFLSSKFPCTKKTADVKIHPNELQRVMSSASQELDSYPCPCPSVAVAPSLSNRQMKELFPFCVVFDKNMIIVDCGHYLVEKLGGKTPVGSHCSDILKVKKPTGSLESWSSFLKLHDISNSFISEMKCPDGTILRLRGMITLSDDVQRGYYMCHADVHSIREMESSHIHPRHLAADVCRMDYVLESEHLLSETRATLKVERMQKDLEKKDMSLETKRTFVRYIGHEIRTPLTVVKLGLRIALEDAVAMGASEEVLSNITDCEDSVDVAVAILNDLLAYEKLDSGLLEMFNEVIVVIPFITRSIRPFGKQAKEKNIDLRVENTCSSEDIESLAIYADKSKMSQVLRNFISNALKFTPNHGKVTVRISLNRNEKGTEAGKDRSRRILARGHSRANLSGEVAMPNENGSNKIADCPKDSPANSIRRKTSVSVHDDLMVPTKSPAYKTIKSKFDDVEFRLLEEALVVEFIDSGVGISEENQKKLFKEIVQFDPHINQGGGGSGLGLWISQGIIKLHFGKLGVRSNSDKQKGTTFSLQLPVYRRMSQQIQSSFIDSWDDILLPKKENELKESEKGIDSNNNNNNNNNNKSISNNNDNVLVVDGGLASTEVSDSKALLTLLINEGGVDVVKDVSLVATQGQNSRVKKPGALNGCRILIVDDARLIIKVVSKTFTSLGAECDSALDGKEAIELMKEKCLYDNPPFVQDMKEVDEEESAEKTQLKWDNSYYDIVMLDKQMPVLDGVQTCMQLRASGYTGCIVGVTGSCMPSEVEEFRKAGVNDVFSKPLDVKQLEIYVERIRREKGQPT